MAKRRILFMLEPFDKPFGGVAVIYQHVEVLNEAGVEAYVALRRQPDVDFYDRNAPLLLHGGSVPVEPGDICVVPEGFHEYFRAFQGVPATVVMFCQNHFYLPFTDNPAQGVRELRADLLVVSSEAIRDFFADVYGLRDVPVIPCAVDAAFYKPAGEKKRQIAYMPRKLPAEGAFIKAVFRRMYPRHSDVPWIAIEGVDRYGVAQALGQSEVFLSLSHRDSLGLPPLEAMASGCLVAGFHGEGGREYATAENGWWADDGDWRRCVDGLDAALRATEEGGEPLERRLSSMRDTVKRYSPERMKAALLNFWQPLVDSPWTGAKRTG